MLFLSEPDNAAFVHTISLVVFGSTLLALAFIDARTLRLPDILTLPLLWLGRIGLECHIGYSGNMGSSIGIYIVMVARAYFLYVACRHAIGHGDAKLLAVIGAWLGADALPPVLIVASAAGLVFRAPRKMPFIYLPERVFSRPRVIHATCC